MSASDDALPGIRLAAVTAWVRARWPGAVGELRLSAVPGGRSNLTFLVEDAEGQRVVLRRPPLGALAESAHDVLREARILRALAGTAVRVPAVLAVCADSSVTGAPFVVMQHMTGISCQTPADAQLLPMQARAQAGRSLVATLLALQRLDPDQLGLGALGRGTGYFGRQLSRWLAQWERTRTRELPAIQAAHLDLAAAVPQQERTVLVHGDYRLDNCLVGPDGEVTAVLDWELATLGDPRADLGLLLAYWADPDDVVTALEHPATVVAGFPRRAEVASLARSGSGSEEVRGVEGLDFATAFAWWKLACIVEGVYSRVKSGAMPSPDRSPASFAAQAERLAERAADLAAGLSGPATHPNKRLPG